MVGGNVLKTDFSDIATALDALGVSSGIATACVSGLSLTKISFADIKLLQDAVHSLESGFSSNCCQVDCCQTCQTQTCQSSSCQSASCQSLYCQSCQGCQYVLLYNYYDCLSNGEG